MESLKIVALTTVSILFVIAGLYIVVPYVVKLLIKRKLSFYITKENSVYLTFDDGPDPEATPQILEMLDKYNARATFFAIGAKIEKYPDIVSTILKSGNSIGSHGYRHLHGWKATPFSMLRDLKKEREILAKYFSSERQILYRPPFGKLNLINLFYYLRRNGKIVFWDCDPEDYKAASPDQIADYILENVRPGSIILLHDGRSKEENNSADVTVKALELILRGLSDLKFECVTIEEGIKKTKAPTLPVN